MKRNFFIFILLSVYFTACMATGQTRNAGPSAPVKAADSHSNDDFFFDDSDDKSQTVKVESVAETVPAGSAGYASWYGEQFQGRPTASGELFDKDSYTAAHRTLPFGSVVLVRNTENQKKTLVKIVDRGPFVEGRLIDLSEAAARDLGMVEAGVAQVSIEVVSEGPASFSIVGKEPPAAVAAAEPEAPAEEAVPAAEPEDPAQIAAENTGIVHNDGQYTFDGGFSPRGYTVQVGAFQKRTNAENYRTEMENKFNRRAFIAARGKWYFVWLGDFSDTEQARVFLRQLKEAGVDVIYRGKIS